ncbi:nitric oxide reductase transcriptional regulator NorR [Vibrio sp. SCSIO 43137]|uniref:nitric oxide reductase transcriptional regulator NorR n=1 Tax=Vibrio sp. SCSIO 43137 TaxID=3021011 RepID=UPI002307656D|nr:nitric oxide reductase transcriptional regulator NorR [Vibrio sp. SCSIO 43137]WCE32379.1 nitric oxide reductase transcriptional regulator NorR [Vibrio sp. SCSIO 43137]
MTPSLEKVLLQIALDLTSELPKGQHYQKLIDAVNKVLPCDASALFVLDKNNFLVPVAVSGLSTSVLGRKFDPKEHPRLKKILSSRKPVRFSADSKLPDPFDGLLSGAPQETIDVHDCMGCSLYVEEKQVGLLTLDALNTGAFDKTDAIVIETFAAMTAATLRNITLFEALQESNRQQKSINQLLIEQARHKQGELVGLSPQMQSLKESIGMVAQSNYAVLISGETGTGKELVAHALHEQSSRSDKPMVYVNCAALPESIAESELFGHVKGAFTGAVSNRAGKFEMADGGTIFLDEIGELPLLLQAKLLRVIQQGEVQRVGADRNLQVDVRIIAATNRDLHEEVSLGNFRADLFHRLNVFPIYIPPLREREGDIPVLAGYLLDKVRSQFKVPNLYIHPESLCRMEKMEWKGNVRELEHTLMRISLKAIQQGEHVIHFDHSEPQISPQKSGTGSAFFTSEPTPMRESVEAFQKQLIEHALQQCDGVWAKAAQFLQLDRGNLYRMGKKLGVDAKSVVN